MQVWDVAHMTALCKLASVLYIFPWHEPVPELLHFETPTFLQPVNVCLVSCNYMFYSGLLRDQAP